MFNLSSRSRKAFKGVHPDLVAVIERAIEITEVDFLVGEGVRTPARQRLLMKRGATRTFNSKHFVNPVTGYGHAVDLYAWVEGKITWDTGDPDDFYRLSHDDSYDLYQEIGTSVLQAAKELGHKVTWGADWDGDGQHTDHSFIDWVHFQLEVD